MNYFSREMCCDKLLIKYLECYEDFIKRMPKNQLRRECISGLNRVKRIDYWSSLELNVRLKPGDICYFEYGQAFLNEAGYQHFGLVISIHKAKAFVIPMTSNTEMVEKALSEENRKENHLFYIGKLEGMHKPSVLFLNDCKFINTCRIISTTAHLPRKSKMFEDIRDSLKTIIFP